MDTKQFITMAVTLIVGVILVAGVLTPVIADSIGSGSSDDESVIYRNDTNEFTTYYIKLQSNSSFSMIPIYNPDSDYPQINCDGSYMTLYSNPFMMSDWTDIGVVTIGEDVFFNTDFGSYARADVNGTTVTFSEPEYDDRESYTLSDVLFCAYPDGDYVCTWGDSPSLIYISNESIVFLQGHDQYGEGAVTITGSAEDNVVVWTDGTDVYNLGSATFNFKENILKSVTVVIDGVEEEYICSYLEDDPPSDNALYIENFIVPKEVSIGGNSDDYGVSGTLATLLTVIPILVMAGLVIMTVAYFRRS